MNDFSLRNIMIYTHVQREIRRKIIIFFLSVIMNRLIKNVKEKKDKINSFPSFCLSLIVPFKLTVSLLSISRVQLHAQCKYVHFLEQIIFQFQHVSSTDTNNYLSGKISLNIIWHCKIFFSLDDRRFCLNIIINAFMRTC